MLPNIIRQMYQVMEIKSDIFSVRELRTPSDVEFQQRLSVSNVSFSHIPVYKNFYSDM
jgi:hypothetical protein